MRAIEVKELVYSYRTKYQTIHALKGITCSFDYGSFYAVVGPSGSGKTTLLTLMAGLNKPDSGSIFVDGNDLNELDMDAYHREKMAMVYQSFNLLPLLTAEENVALPMMIRNIPEREAKKAAQELLKEVGLPQKIYKQMPSMMSGGEQQRVAIARALASEGKILFADEPTGNLDSENGAIILELLKKLAHEKGFCVIVNTHDQNVAEEADVVCVLKDGQLIAQS